ncbi:hypothetical protein ARMGADRAFT_1031507 [Armillaria gallica]|uniref:Uncharacterized protein n=1 Tax=Armillaria gallica TaxID=47427 RepID=A0A2H3DA03_ARMGA|nr:hypothetical protein ARMGADRAFT_1031507 [Armillaria gallica]
MAILHGETGWSRPSSIRPLCYQIELFEEGTVGLASRFESRPIYVNAVPYSRSFIANLRCILAYPRSPLLVVHTWRGYLEGRDISHCARSARLPDNVQGDVFPSSYTRTREVKDTRYCPAVLFRPSIPNAKTLENVDDNAEIPTGYYRLAFKLRRRELSKLIGDNAWPTGPTIVLRICSPNEVPTITKRILIDFLGGPHPLTIGLPPM